MKRTRIRSVSKKRRAGQKDWDEVYRVVDARSGGRCEVEVWVTFNKWAQLHRCQAAAEEHHHLRKPRAHNHEPGLIVHICKAMHRQVDAPFVKGRLIISASPVPVRFIGRIVTAASKQEAKRLGLIA